MSRIFRPAAIAAVFAVALFAGCGGGDGAASSDQTPDETAARDERGPKEVLAAFLESSQKGDNQAVESMLSAKAREALRKENIDVTPPNVPYEIGDVEMLNEGQGAHIYSAFTEPKFKTKLEMLWVLRNDDEGWRIIGTIVKPPEGGPFPFDFEDVASMVRTEEAMKQQQAGSQQSGNAARADGAVSTARFRGEKEAGAMR